MQEGVALLVITAAAYLAGLLVLVVVAAFKFNRLWCGVLLAYVVVPGAYVYISGSADQAASDRVEEDFRLGTERNLQAFADYCKDRRRVIHRTVPPATEDSLLIRLEHEPHKRSDFEAYSIHKYLNTGRQRSICEKTSVAYLAGNDKFYVSDKQAFQTEMRLFRLCSLEGAWRHRGCARDTSS